MSIDKDGGDPAAGRPYRTDANYYRLGYQLAAQSQHQAETGSVHKPAVRSAADILYGDWAARGQKKDSKAEGVAEALLLDAKEVLSGYEARDRDPEPKRWRPFVRREALTDKERRLVRFLERTVVPCLTIVLAASVRDRDSERADHLVSPLRKRAELTIGPTAEAGSPLSYRALYNLACYEAGGSSAETTDRALRYLLLALNQASPSRRVELIEWAKKDPSLKGVSESKEFSELTEQP